MDYAQTLNLLGKPLCINSDLYTIYNTLHIQEHDPDLSALKLYENSLENLVQVDYRCPKCRNCQNCRDAHQTERVSLREEQEDALIKDCVTLDYENQRFLCSLPLRGKAEDFLVTNKRDAQKVLDRQVLLYHKEEATKDLIVKAMNKLFKKNHIQLLKDLPEHTQRMILDEAVNYFIPWRVVFKASSISTPARPVFDCSAKTP